MRLRDFAERVLLGRRLEDKLSPPGPLDDEDPGPPLGRPPDWPGRPPELALDRGRVRPRLPGIDPAVPGGRRS